MIPTVCLSNSLPDTGIAVDPSMMLSRWTSVDRTRVEQLVDLVVSGEMVRGSVELVDRPGAAEMAKPGPAADRLISIADPTTQEIGKSVDHNLGQVADAVGYIP